MDEINETPQVETEEEAKEPIFVKCSRCGEEVEVDEEGEEIEECANCEDWIFCDSCEEWHPADGSGEVHISRNETETWCESCMEDAYFCAKCETYHSDELTTVHTTERTGPYNRRATTQEWCDKCLHRDAFTCVDCEEWFDNEHCDNCGYEGCGGSLCDGCYSDGHWWCEGCECDQRNGESCNCDERRDEGRVAAYGDHGEFTLHKNFPGPTIGLEMEVGEFEGGRDDFMSDYKDALGHAFAFPTADASLKSSGIEFIGHPRTALDHLAIWDDYEEFFRLLHGHAATLSTAPSGCHTNMPMLSPDGVRAAVIAVERFRSALLKFTDPRMLSRRADYCYKSDAIKDDPHEWKTTKYHGAAALKGSDKLVEFRIAGMTLDIRRFHAQIQLFHNLWSWCDTIDDPWKAAYLPFDEIFLPTMFNACIEDVIQEGMRTPPLPVDTGSLDSPNWTGNGKPEITATMTLVRQSDIADSIRQLQEFTF